MRYLTLAADHREPSVTEPDGRVDLGSLGLSTSLLERIEAWNAAYQAVVRATPQERSALQVEIDRLDHAGRALAAEIAHELAPAKVRYVSEGDGTVVTDPGAGAAAPDGRSAAVDRLLCGVCGYRATEPPWGADGRSPSFAFCPSCGVEWGYQDATPTGVERFRRAWLASGAPWRDPSVPPDGLTAQVRLQRVDP